MTRTVPWLVMIAAGVLGGGSLLLFVYFLNAGPIVALAWPNSEAGRLAWDGFLSILFFAQHSVMVRRGVQSRLTRFIPEDYYRAAYAITSGVALLPLVLLWQPVDTIWLELDGAWRWVPKLTSVITVADFVWAIRSIGSFDAFGTAALHRHLSACSPQPPAARESADPFEIERPSPPFVIRGPYRHIRHPFYAFALVGIWSTAHVTSDRLLFNVVWTAWIVVATRWEERDLLAEFGAAYGAYQARVPMLLPRLHRASAR